MKRTHTMTAPLVLLAISAAAAAHGATGAMTSAGKSSAASQQGQAGDSVVSPDLGLGAPVSELDLTRFGGGHQRPGDPALSVGARYLYQTSERVSFGAEINHTAFGDRDFAEPGLAGTVGGSLLTAQGLARYVFLPERSVAPYAIGGLGLNRFAAHVFETGDPTDVLLDTDSIGLTVSAGGGVEGRFGKDKSLVTGAEARWMLSTIDSSKFGVGALSSLGLAGHVGYRF